jgi:hypothetical protein
MRQVVVVPLLGISRRRTEDLPRTAAPVGPHRALSAAAVFVLGSAGPRRGIEHHRLGRRPLLTATPRSWPPPAGSLLTVAAAALPPPL